MKVRDLNDVMVHWQDFKYRDYNVEVWDWRRQRKMDLVFTGASHPEKSIYFNVTDVDDPKWLRPEDAMGMARELPSPFAEGSKAILCEDPDFTCMGRTFKRYFYRCEKTEKTFTTSMSDTYTMCNYYREECKALREELKGKETESKTE